MGLKRRESKRVARNRREAFHRDSPTRRRAQKMTGGELNQWAEAISMNMNYWVSKWMNNPDINAIDEALQHNDALCAILLEIQARAELKL